MITKKRVKHILFYNGNSLAGSLYMLAVDLSVLLYQLS